MLLHYREKFNAQVSTAQLYDKAVKFKSGENNNTVNIQQIC